MDFNYLDIIIAIPVLIGAVQGFKRGVIHEILMLIGVIVAIYIGYHFSDFAANWIISVTDKASGFLPIISFILTFLTVIVGFLLTSKLLSAVLNLTGLGFFNKFFGAVFGGLKYAAIISLIFIFLLPMEEKFEIIDKKVKRESVFFRPLVDLGVILQPKLFHLKDRIEDELEKIDDYKEEEVERVV